MSNIPENTTEITNESVAETSFEAPKKKSKKGLLIGVFAVIALIVVAGLFMSGNKQAENDYVIAQSKKAIYLIDVANPEKEPVKIDDLKGDDEIWMESYINEERTKVLYVNSLQEDTEDYEMFFELWLYDIVLGEKSLVDENVCMYSVNSTFDTVTYFKGREGELWQKKADSEPVKLYDRLINAWISDDMQTIVYTDADKNTYAKQADAEPQLLGSEILTLDFDGNALLYADDEKLVKYENGETKVISEEYSKSANLSFYDYDIGCKGGYFFSKKQNIDVDGCFVDDMEESDKNIKASDVEAYAEKIARDALRLELAASKEWEFALCDLYYYDGNEAVLVCENVIEILEDASYYSTDDDSMAIAYRVLGEYELPKLVMSEFYEKFKEEYCPISQIFYDALLEQSDIGFAKKGKHLGAVELKDTVNYVYDADNSIAYVMTETLGDGGEFDFIETYYTVKLGEDSVSEPVLYEEDICSEITEVVDGELFYCRYDDEEEYMTIYKDKEIIAENVFVAYWLETGVLYVGIEGEEEDVPGKIYTDGKFIEYDGMENLSMVFATEDGNIVCYEEDDKFDIVVAKDGKLITVPGNSKYTCVDLIYTYENNYEISSPLFTGNFLEW